MSQTTTNRGRGAVATPDLAYDTLDGGAALFATINVLWTWFSDHATSRYYSQSGMANNATITIQHNFGLTFANLRYRFWESGALRTAAQVASDYQLVAVDANSFTLKNVSGGAKTFLFVVSAGFLQVQSADFDPAVALTTTGTVTSAGLQQSGDTGIVLNSGASESGANWKATLKRPTSGMTADTIITLPAATASLATLALAETLASKTLTGCGGVTLNAGAAIDWAAGNVSLGASIGANTLTVGGASSTVKVAGTLWAVGQLETDGNTLILNQSATESGASWKGTLTRPASGMTADATWTMPIGTDTMVGRASVDALTNKDYQGGTASNTSRLRVPRDTYTNLTALTRQAGVLVYATDQNTLYADSGSALVAVGSSGGGGGGGGLIWNGPAGSAPVLDEDQGAKVYRFDTGSATVNTLVAWLKVPSGYIAGNQIKMKIGHYCPSVTGTILMATTVDLIRKGTVTAVSSTTNAYSSTNAAINLATAGVANGYYEAVCDLTDGTGKVNSVAVAAGDLLRVVLFRSGDTATGDIYFPPETTEVTFS